MPPIKTLADVGGDRDALRDFYGDRVVNFYQNVLKHTEDPYYGHPFVLAPWQESEIIRPLFDNVDDDGHRVYRKAYIEIGRKNGKSELAAGIALYLLTMDGEMGAQIYGAASDRDQASLVFNVAAKMVRLNPALSKRLKVVDSRKTITDEKTGSFYRAIPADAAGAHGFNAHGIIFDELHAQKTRELWDVLTTSMGTRKQPLVFAITTAGYDRESICWEQHEYTRKVNDGVFEDPSRFGRIWAVPEDLDWQDEDNWKMANPALGDFRDVGEMRDMCRQARRIPALENTFRNLYLSQWTQSASRYIPMHEWEHGSDGLDPDELTGRECYAGLDLATTTDVAALVLVFPPAGDSDQYKVLPYFWVPEDTIVERSKREGANYDAWRKAGHMFATPGNVIDYAFIRHQMNQLSEQFNIREVAHDRWGATKLVTELQDDGFTLVQFGQGYASMSPPTKELLKLVLQKRLHHGGNPVLNWMCDNLVVRMDPAGNVKPDKEKSTEKIDGMVALIMGLDRAIKHKPTAPLMAFAV